MPALILSHSKNILRLPSFLSLKMARKKLLFAKDGEEEDGKQTLDKAGEEGTALVSPKKIKLNADRERVGPEPAENGSACSSPSASDFIVMPTLKPKKKASFTKIFSDEDEIALLRGLAVFWADGRKNKWTEFYQFIKDDLANQFSKVQVSEKVRKLRLKFETNFVSARANGGKFDFSNSHESNVFRLCKALWGDENGVVEENEDEKGNKIERKRKEVGEVNDDEESNKMQRKGKKVNEGVRKKKKERKQVHESGEKGKKLEQEKEVDEHHQEDNIPGEQKQVDEIIELKQGNDVDEDNEENNFAEKEKEQVMEISQEDFQSEFPLFYASFDTFKYPNIVKEKCVLIPREKVREVEEKCRELRAEALRLELKRIDLVKRDLQHHLEEI